MILLSHKDLLQMLPSMDWGQLYHITSHVLADGTERPIAFASRSLSKVISLKRIVLAELHKKTWNVTREVSGPGACLAWRLWENLA